MTPDRAFDKSHLHLAIDQGGHASRALVFNGQGLVVAEAARAVGVRHPAPDCVEQDPDELVASVQSAVAAVMATLGTRAAQVVNAGLATQRSSIVCWDRRTGAALSPVISWQDRRAHAWLARFADQAEPVHRATGLVLSAHYGASKLRWCLDHLPAVQAARASGDLLAGPLAAFLVFRLTREHAPLLDPANAARTLLWSIRTFDWDPALLELFGVPVDCLPRCVPTRHAYGTLEAGDHVVPLNIVTGDQSAALFSDGQPLPDTAYVNVGTGAFVQRTAGHYPGFSHRLLTGVVLRDGDEVTYTLEGTVNGAGSALAWLQAQVELPGLEQTLPEWLRRNEEPPLFINGVSGVGSPYWIAHLVPRFVGAGGPWLQAVAVLESIVFLLQENLEEFAHLSSPLESLRASGGLTVYDGLCQRLADISGLPLYRPRVFEATARGTAFLLAGCPATWPEPELGIWFKPHANPELRARYGRWKLAMQQAIVAGI